MELEMDSRVASESDWLKGDAAQPATNVDDVLSMLASLVQFQTSSASPPRPPAAPAVDASASEATLESEHIDSVAAARYRTLIEQIPAVTFLASLEGDRNELYVSPQIESLLGFTQAEWVNDPVLWYRQTHPDDRKRVSSTLPAPASRAIAFRT